MILLNYLLIIKNKMQLRNLYNHLNFWLEVITSFEAPEFLQSSWIIIIRKILNLQKVN